MSGAPQNVFRLKQLHISHQTWRLEIKMQSTALNVQKRTNNTHTHTVRREALEADCFAVSIRLRQRLKPAMGFVSERAPQSCTAVWWRESRSSRLSTTQRLCNINISLHSYGWLLCSDSCDCRWWTEPKIRPDLTELKTTIKLS